MIAWAWCGSRTGRGLDGHGVEGRQRLRARQAVDTRPRAGGDRGVQLQPEPARSKPGGRHEPQHRRHRLEHRQPLFPRRLPRRRDTGARCRLRRDHGSHRLQAGALAPVSGLMLGAGRRRGGDCLRDGLEADGGARRSTDSGRVLRRWVTPAQCREHPCRLRERHEKLTSTCTASAIVTSASSGITSAEAPERAAAGGARRGGSLPEASCGGRRRRRHARRRTACGPSAARRQSAPDGDRLRQRPDGRRRLWELRRSGRRVPDDVSVTGFDDITLAQFCQPALTMMHIPRDTIGQMIATS